MCLMVCLCSTDQLTMLDLANRDSYLTEKDTFRLFALSKIMFLGRI